MGVIVGVPVMGVVGVRRRRGMRGGVDRTVRGVCAVKSVKTIVDPRE